MQRKPSKATHRPRQSISQPQFSQDHVVSFANPEYSGEDQYRLEEYFPDDHTVPSSHHEHHHHHHHLHNTANTKLSTCWRVSVAIVSIFSILLLAAAAVAMVYLVYKEKLGTFPTWLGYWAHWAILCGNPAGILGFVFLICIAACCQELFKSGPTALRWVAFGVINVLLVAALVANGFTLSTLIMINKETVLDYTMDCAKNKPNKSSLEGEGVLPPYVRRMDIITGCVGLIVLDALNSSKLSEVLGHCAGNYTHILRVEPPNDMADAYGVYVDKAMKRNTTEQKDTKKKEGKSTLYTYYGVWLGVMGICGLTCVIIVCVLAPFNYYVVTNMLRKSTEGHPKKVEKRRSTEKSKHKKEKRGSGSSSSSTGSFADSLDENITADKDDQRRAVKRFLLHRHDEDSITDLVRIQTRDGATPEEIAARISHVRNSQNAQDQQGAFANPPPGQYNPNQGMPPGPGYDPRYYMPPPPQINFIQLPGGVMQPAPIEHTYAPAPARAPAPEPPPPPAAPEPPPAPTPEPPPPAPAPEPSPTPAPEPSPIPAPLPTETPAGPQNVVLNPQFTLHQTKTRKYVDDDDDSDDEDRKKKKKKKSKKLKKKKSKKKKKKKKKGKKKKKKE